MMQEEDPGGSPNKSLTRRQRQRAKKVAAKETAEGKEEDGPNEEAHPDAAVYVDLDSAAGEDRVLPQFTGDDDPVLKDVPHIEKSKDPIVFIEVDSVVRNDIVTSVFGIFMLLATHRCEEQHRVFIPATTDAGGSASNVKSGRDSGDIGELQKQAMEWLTSHVDVGPDVELTNVKSCHMASSDVAGARAALRKACPKIDAFFSRDKDIDVGSLWNACELWMPHRHSTFANDLLMEPEEDAGSEQVLTFQATRAIRRLDHCRKHMKAADADGLRLSNDELKEISDGRIPEIILQRMTEEYSRSTSKNFNRNNASIGEQMSSHWRAVADKIAEWDAHLGISTGVSAAATNVHATIAKTDEDYHISEKAGAAAGHVKNQMAAADEYVGISDSIAAAHKSLTEKPKKKKSKDRMSRSSNSKNSIRNPASPPPKHNSDFVYSGGKEPSPRNDHSSMSIRNSHGLSSSYNGGILHNPAARAAAASSSMGPLPPHTQPDAGGTSQQQE